MKSYNYHRKDNICLHFRWLKSRDFRGMKFSCNKFSLLACQKTANLVELIFAIELFIMNFMEFIFVMGRFERLQEEGEGNNYETIHITLFI